MCLWWYSFNVSDCSMLTFPCTTRLSSELVSQPLIIEVWLITLVGVILVHVAIVVVVHALSLLLAMSACFDLVIFVHALGLGELVDFTSDEACKEFLGEGVVNGLALSALLVLEEFHSFKSCCATDDLVGELALVAFIAVVHLLVVVTVIIEPTHVE